MQHTAEPTATYDLIRPELPAAVCTLYHLVDEVVPRCDRVEHLARPELILLLATFQHWLLLLLLLPVS